MKNIKSFICQRSSCITNLFAIIFLVTMFITALFSMKNDALTFDELAHIPAGYSYLLKQDYRVNPEHPPLIKDIPAIPLRFLDLNFPDNQELWLQKESAPAWWVQFDLGREFIYRSGNNPKQIIFWSRLAMIIVLMFLGVIIFLWTKKKLGNAIALGVLFIFTFSPTFIAHGRLVNTDIGAVFGAFIAITFWLKFLENPTFKNTLLAGIAFGIAMALKFSLILIVPCLIIITFIYARLFSKKIIPYFGKAAIAAIAAFVLVIWPVYQFHIINYPEKHQIRDTVADISGHPVPMAKDITIWMTNQPMLRAPAQYLRGLLMASQRTAWGNTAYFWGKMSDGRRLLYFPALYLFKIPLAFHVLTLLAGFMLIRYLKGKNSKKRFYNWLRRHFWALSFIIWICIYWASALAGNLNIGIRHMLPIFPFVYILVISALYCGLVSIKKPELRNALFGLTLILFLFYALSSLINFPHYLSYYNELAGGTKNGYKIAVDSNYDWGQDFYRLLNFIEKNNIEKISIDYFGGEDPKYWLKDKYQQLNPKKIAKGEQSVHGWVAVSLNQLMGGIAKPGPRFKQETGYYNWLQKHNPIARAGHSIFIYYID